MTPPAIPSDRPARGDRAGILTFMLIGVALVAVTAAGAVSRLVELFGSAPAAVPARFAATEASAPLGPGGAPTPVELDRALVHTTELPVASLIAGVLETITLVITVSVVVACLLIVARNILRGIIFSRTQTRCVATASITALVGAALAPFFGNMVANGALARISDGEFTEGVVLAVEPLPFLLGAFAASIAITAFTVGDRLRRETEGLV